MKLDGAVVRPNAWVTGIVIDLFLRLVFVYAFAQTQNRIKKEDNSSRSQLHAIPRPNVGLFTHIFIAMARDWVKVGRVCEHTAWACYFHENLSNPLLLYPTRLLHLSNRNLVATSLESYISPTMLPQAFRTRNNNKLRKVSLHVSPTPKPAPKSLTQNKKIIMSTLWSLTNDGSRDGQKINCFGRSIVVIQSCIASSFFTISNSRDASMFLRNYFAIQYKGI